MTSVDENSVMEPFDSSVAVGGLKLLGERNMNVFWQLTRHGRKFFVKGVNPRHGDTARALSVLRKEYDLGMRLEHSGIVRFLSLETIPGVGEAILMEWIEGVSLTEWMSSYPSRSRRVKVAREIIEALCYMAHKGVAHRDLKPDNIMVRDRDGSVCLIDFGHGDSDDFVTHKLAAGTTRFGAPEQKSHAFSDGAADVYALGKILEFLRLYVVYRPVIKACLNQNPAARPKIDALRRRFRRCGLIGRISLPVAAVILLIAVCGFFALQTDDNDDNVSLQEPTLEAVQSAAHTIDTLKETVTEEETVMEEETVAEKEIVTKEEIVTEAAKPVPPEHDYTAEKAYYIALRQTDSLLKNYDAEFRRIREADYSAFPGQTKQEFFNFTEKTFAQEGETFGKILAQMGDELNALGVPAPEITDYLTRLHNYHRDAVAKATGL